MGTELVSVPPLRVFFYGRRGSGKSTAAKYFAAVSGAGILSIAEPLRQVAAIAFPGRTDRKLLQTLGDKLREIDRDCLLNIVLSKAAEYPGPVVIDDLRLVREAEVLRRHGFVGVLVRVSDDVRRQRLLARGENPRPAEDLHATEAEVDAIQPDFILENDADVTDEEFRKKVFVLLGKIVARGIDRRSGIAPRFSCEGSCVR